MNHPSPDIQALPPQPLSAYKRLVQFIHEEDLQEGDRLPTQADLRRLLDKNNYTLGAAMQALADQGVVARKTRVGTIIRDLSAIGPIPWSVGVATLEAPVRGELSTFANLALRIHTRLSSAGCRCLSYSRPVDRSPDQLGRFGLLPHDIDNGLLDGVVLLTTLDVAEWRRLRERRIPCVHLPFWQNAPGGVVYDFASLIHDALAEFLALGCRELAVVSVFPAEPVPRFYQEAVRLAAGSGLEPERVRHLDGSYGVEGGERVARQLLSLPEAERPSGLVVLDDYVALGLTNVLSQSEWRPHIAAHVQQQLPLRYALPVIRHAVDLEEMSRRAIRLLHQRLLRPSAPEVLEQMPSTRINPRAFAGQTG